MTFSADAAEAILLTAYAEEAARYEQALALASQLAGPLADGQAPEAAMRQIVQLMDQVAAIETRITETKTACQKANHRASLVLRARLDRVTGLIRQLAERIHAAESVAVQKRDRILPDLEAASRSRRMQRAYGKPPTGPLVHR